MTPRLLFEIGEEHVGRRVIQLPGCPCCGARGRVVWLTDSIGVVLPGDVGKRVYDSGGVIQVENNEQRDRRKSGLTATRVADTVEGP